MKRSFLTALLFSSFFTPVFAADVIFSSSVDAVTVYPRGAQVMRVAAGNVPVGDNVIIINDLPGKLVRNSVRVEGTSGQSLEIGSIDVRQRQVLQNENQDERLKIEREIEGLNDQISVQNQTISNANAQRRLLQNLAAKSVVPRPTVEGGSVAINADQLGELLDLTGTRLAGLTEITEKTRIENRNLSRQIADLQKKLAQTAPKRRIVTSVAINLSAKAAGDANFKIRYNVSNAGWSPVYDAKLTLGKQGKNNVVKLVRRANVRQATTDKWQDIKLTLSTARPNAATRGPDLFPYILSEVKHFSDQRRLRKKNRGVFSSKESAAMDSVAAPTVAAPAPIGRLQVAVAFSGFQAEYKIPGKVSISNAGAQKNVIIGEREFEAEISAVTAPKLDQTAYLTANFTLKGDAPYLPGTVLLSRDGVYLGRGHLPLLNPDEEHELSFGRDDFVKVKHRKVAEKAGESGIISRSREETRKFVTTVTNLHDFPIKVVVNDQFPYGTHEDIKINMISGSTKPTKQNVDKKRGVVAWEKDLAAKEEYTIYFGYKVSWPKDMKITPVR